MLFRDQSSFFPNLLQVKNISLQYQKCSHCISQQLLCGGFHSPQVSREFLNFRILSADRSKGPLSPLAGSLVWSLSLGPGPFLPRLAFSSRGWLRCLLWLVSAGSCVRWHHPMPRICATLFQVCVLKRNTVISLFTLVPAAFSLSFVHLCSLM